MKRHFARLALASICSLGLATPARAGNFNFDYYCSMGAFQVCASVRLFTTGNQLKMQVWNLEGTLGVQHTMTAIGLYHSGTDDDWAGKIQSYSVTYNGNDITSYWTKKGSNDIGTLAGTRLELREGTQGNAGIIGCLNPGGGQKWPTCMSFDSQPYVEFTFNLNSPFSLENVQLRWHSQQLPDGSSIKCDTGGAGDYPDCVNTPPNVVPEPATVVLMGTGLVGLVGAAKRRRKKDEKPIA